MKHLSGTQVLLIEDGVMIASMVEEMLVELGATVVGAASSINKAWCAGRQYAFGPSVRAEIIR